MKNSEMQEWFSLITAGGLTPNQVYLLNSMKMRQQSVLMINIHAELRTLKTLGWVMENNTLTEKAEKFLSELSLFFAGKGKKMITEPVTEDFTGNITKYVQIFPKQKLPSGKQARVHPGNLENGFRWFFTRYSYSWDVIFRATQKYVTEFEHRGYEHMRTSQYFLRKQLPDKSWMSDLADYCAVVDDVEENTSEKTFEEKVN